MMSSSRNNRLTVAWTCPHCQNKVDGRTFRLAPGKAGEVLCANAACRKTFPWQSQNKGKLWPEQRAYSVLR